MMLQRLFENSLWVRPLVMMLALGSLTAESALAQSSSTRDDDIVAILVEHSRQSGRPAGSGGDGGDIIVFDIIDSVAVVRVMLLDESAVPGVYEVLVDTGDSIEFGLMWEVEPAVQDGKPKATGLTIQLQIRY